MSPSTTLPPISAFIPGVFGQQPAVVKEDYAKWMLDDPRINFAISNRGLKAGVDHLGIQVDSDEELAVLRDQVRNADIAARDQPGAACCYANSNKYWITDPQGIAWETYHTLGSIPTFGQDAKQAAKTGWQRRRQRMLRAGHQNRRMVRGPRVRPAAEEMP